MHTQSRKYLCVHVQGQSCQFKALPFGLSTAPMEFLVVVKEVKLMVLHRGIRIHHYLTHWLVRARSHETCLKHTQILVALVSGTRLDSEYRQFRTGDQTGLRLHRLPFRSQRGQCQTNPGTLADFKFKDPETTL